jgi:hypothetical protein
VLDPDLDQRGEGVALSIHALATSIVPVLLQR